MPKYLFASLLVCSLGFVSPSQADTSTDAQKLEFIRSNFQQAADHSRYWQQGWLTIFGASAVVQGTLWNVSGSHKERYDGKIGFISSALGVGDLLLSPMPTHNYAQKLSQPDVQLEQAERWLADAAAKEQYQRSFTNHLLSGLVSAAAGLAVALDDKRPSDGWLTFATNMLASEAKIYTAPTHMTATWQAYQRGDTSAYRSATHAEQAQWQVSAAGPVLMVRYQF